MALGAEALLSRAVRLAHPLRVHLHWFSTVIELDMQAEDVPQRAELLAVEVQVIGLVPLACRAAPQQGSIMSCMSMNA